MRIVFMGTPDFAVPCLEQLLSDGHTVSAVFTQPDKPHGRHHSVLIPPPVKELALRWDLPVHQPTTLRDGAAYERIRACQPDVIVVIAYGKILPKDILDIPLLGCINIHASLLPRLRGAAPIQWAVLNGETVTGVTSMLMDEGVDTGDMLLTEQLDIGENETAGELFDRLSVLGASVLHDTLAALEEGTLEAHKQDDTRASYAPVLQKSFSPIDWTKSAQHIHNHIRGLSPWPVASAVLDGKILKIYESRLIPEMSGAPGELLEARGRLLVACGQGVLELLTVQPEGKKQMSAAQYVAGNPPKPGTQMQ